MGGQKGAAAGSAAVGHAAARAMFGTGPAQQSRGVSSSANACNNSDGRVQHARMVRTFCRLPGRAAANVLLLLVTTSRCVSCCCATGEQQSKVVVIDELEAQADATRGGKVRPR
jgi:hypothetical protein